MDKLRSNPYLLGSALGLVSVIIYYVESKFIKGNESVEIIDCVKLFILVTGMIIGAFMIADKKKVVETVKDEIPKLVEQTIHTGDPNF